jgi:hypothetical protein
MSTGYNWIDCLVHFASISGVLAGFSVTFIALVLGGQIGDFYILETGATFGQIAVLLFGISTALFAFASQRFIHAQEFNIWDLPDDYAKFLKEELKKQKKEWYPYLLESDAKSRQRENEGRKAYNLGLLLIFTGLFFSIAPYNLPIALIVSGIGFTLELWQYLT